MTQFTPPEIWKWLVLMNIYAKGSKNSECLGVNLSTMQRIQKEMGESNGDYEDTAAQKSHSDHSEKKKPPKFVGEIQAMTNNDPS